MSSRTSADRNLLFGMLALQLDFIGKDQLITAMQAWVFDKTRSLGDILFSQQAMTPQRHQLIDALVAEHLRQHGNDAIQSLAALSPVGPELRQQLDQLGDADVAASLLDVPKPGFDYQSTKIGAPPPNDQLPRDAGSRYRILRPHARGGIGEVFVAQDLELGRQVALKEIQQRHAANATSRTRFVVEAEITGGLEHPGIVPVYGLGTYADGKPYYAMRFIKGDNLRSAIAKFHTDGAQFDSLEFRRLLRRLVDVCFAMAYAHARGVLHRDLKPGNIMLGRFGETMVVDWGLAKVAGTGGKGPPVSDESEPTLHPPSGGESAATIVGQAIGTPAYMSPEQAAGRLNELGPATDIYSLGATFYELLVGRRPFDGSTAEVLEQVQRGQFLAPKKVNPSVPPELNAICLKAMACKVDDRYRSALELAGEIECWLADQPVAAWPDPFLTRILRWVRRHRTLVSGAALVLMTSLLAAVVGLYFVDRQRRLAENMRQMAHSVLDRMVTNEALNAIERQSQPWPEQAQFYQDVADHYDRLAPLDGDSAERRLQRAKIHRVLSAIFLRIKKPDDAALANDRALALFQVIEAERPNDTSVKQEVAICLFNTACILDAQKKPQLAVDAYSVATEAYQRLGQSVLARQGVIKCQINLAKNLNDRREFAQAEQAYLKALEAQRALMTEADNEANRELMGKIQHGLAQAQHDSGKFSAAHKSYLAAIAVHERLVRDNPKRRDYGFELAWMHYYLALLNDEKMNAPAEAVIHYQHSRVFWQRQLTEFPTRTDYRPYWVDCCVGLGRCLCAVGKVEQAATIAQECENAGDPGGRCHYCAARILARCAAVVTDQPNNRDQYANRAIEMLRIAIRLGFRDPTNQSAGDFKSISQHADFADLTMQLLNKK